MVKHYKTEQRAVSHRDRGASHELAPRQRARSGHVRPVCDVRGRRTASSHVPAVPWTLASPWLRRFCALSVRDCELDSEPHDLVALSTRFGSGSMLAELDENAYRSLRVAASELGARDATMAC